MTRIKRNSERQKRLRRLARLIEAGITPHGGRLSREEIAKLAAHKERRRAAKKAAATRKANRTDRPARVRSPIGQEAPKRISFGDATLVTRNPIRVDVVRAGNAFEALGVSVVTTITDRARVNVRDSRGAECIIEETGTGADIWIRVASGITGASETFSLAAAAMGALHRTGTFGATGTDDATPAARKGRD